MALSAFATQAISFIANVGTSYLLGRLTAQDGPQLADLSPTSGEYGVPMTRVYGEAVRVPGIFIAQADIKETENEVEDYSEIVGAITGAAQGFALGGGVGALIGSAVGFLGGLFAPDQYFYTYSATFATMIADRTDDAAIETVLKIWANSKLIFDSEETPLTETIEGGEVVKLTGEGNRFYNSLLIYPGSPNQAPDAVLGALLGTQPAYKNIAYVVFDDLQLAAFGNAVPRIEILAVPKTGQSLADVVEAICGAAGIDDTRDISSSQLAGITVRGYAITSETNCWDAISPLMPVYRTDAGEVSGQVRFYKRDRGLRATIPLSELGAHEFGSDAPERINYTRLEDVSLPRETALTFLDPDREYQANTATSTRSQGSAESNISQNLALTLTADEGATAAATLHWDAWLGRTAVSTTLTNQWNTLTPGDNFGIPFGDEVLPYRMTRKVRGANGLVEAEFLSAENVAFQGFVTGTSGMVAPPESTLFANTRLIVMDMPMLNDSHDDFGYFVAMSPSASYWERGAIEASDEGTAFAKIVDATGSAVAGDVTGTLAAGTTTGLDNTLDTTSVLTVVLLHDGMTLQNATDTQLNRNVNFAYVGKDGRGEYLQFKTATKIAPRTWELTNLRRGRRGTDYAIGTHTSGEEFCLVGGAGVYRIVYGTNIGWGEEVTLRGVTFNQPPADADTLLFTNTGQSKRPFSPLSLDGTFDGGGDLDLVWVDRERFFDVANSTDLPAEYELRIYDGVTLVRTVTALSGLTYTYTAADQATDGFASSDVIEVRVYRKNAAYGYSFPRINFFVQTISFDSDLVSFDSTTSTWDNG